MAWAARYSSMRPRDMLELTWDEFTTFCDALNEIIQAENGQGMPQS